MPDPIASLPLTSEKPPLRSRTSTSGSNGRMPSPGASAPRNAPPYWNAHQRTASNISYRSITNQTKRNPITLEDHTEASAEHVEAIAAKSVTVDDWAIVGTKVFGEWGPGSYVVWNCSMDMIEGTPIKLRKRYSQFDKLRHELVRTFPKSERSLPPLPPKSVISKFGAQFLEKRRMGLSYFLHCVVLNPEFSRSQILKEFLYS